MTLSQNLDLTEHDTVHEWVTEAADETGVEEKTLWNITEKLLLEPEPMDHFEKEIRLKILYEIHLNRVRGQKQDALGTWVNVKFPTETEGIVFSYGGFEVPLPGGDEQVEVMKRITREEGLEVTVNDPDNIVTAQRDCDPVWAVRITKRILDEVYGKSIGDITWAEEEGGRELTWEEVTEFR